MKAQSKALRVTSMLAWCLLFFGGLLQPAFGQRYHVKNYAEADGLPGPDILGIAQDSNGCIWIATRAGAACYDGSVWRRFSFLDGLDSVDLKHVAIDEAGVPWVATNKFPLRLYTFDGEAWRRRPVHAEFSGLELTTSMALYGGGDDVRVLLGTNLGRLFLWDERTAEWSAFETNLPPVAIDAVVFVRDRFLIAVDGHLFELGETLIEVSSPVKGLRGFCWDEKTQRLFLIGSSSVFLQVGDGKAELWSEYREAAPRGHGVGVVASPGPVHGLYFGNLGGLHSLVRKGASRMLDESSGLSASGVNALLLDREGNLWIGGTRGLSKIVSRRFESYDRTHGLLQSEVTAVVERKDGTIVLGHPDGLTFLEKPPRHLRLGDGHGDARVLDLDEDQDGTLWVSAAWFGLVELRPDGKMIVHGPDEGLNLPVNSGLLGEDGLEWVSTSNGMFRRTDDGFKEVPELSPGDAEGFHFRNLTRDSLGRCYVGTGEHGVLSWGSDLVPRLVGPSDRSALASVYTVQQSPNGQTWVGSAAGLMVSLDGSLSPCLAPEISRPIYFIEPGANGATWFGSNNGVYRWDGEQLKHFGVQHGLSGSETNRAAGLLDSKGRFWIGTNEGVSVYTEAYDFVRPHGPTVEILGCDYPDSEAVGGSKEVVLSHVSNRLTFSYRVIAFTDESRIRFQTYLEGSDDGWSEPHLNSLRQTTYTSLPPGTYKFKIRAVDVEGRVSEIAEWETIRIRQPYWSETWFRLVAILALVGVLSGTATLLSLRRNASRLERQVELRTRELVLSQAATEGERASLELTLANIADGVAAICLEGNVLVWNLAAHRITGWSSEEVLGRSLSEFLGPEAARQGSSCREVTLRTGETRKLELASVETVALGEVLARRVVVFRDVTEKLAHDRELLREDKLEALGLLAGGIAHDFNNLLTVIIGNLSMPLPDDLRCGDLADSLQDASSAANRARLLTLQLLTFSKGGEPVRRLASIGALLAETASLAFRGSDVLCKVDVDDDLHLAEVDEGQMGQVFHNLMINAREAMPAGGTLQVRARNLDHVPPFLTSDEYIVIELKDEGVGMAEADLAHIFDPYFSTKSRGSGLGLAIAYSVVQRHGGHITVDSVVGEGTTFRVYLQDSGAQFPDRDDPVIVQRPEPGARILVMDDEESILRVVTSILERAGYEVACVADGEQAIARYKSAILGGIPFDAVIMDLTIPGGMGGREAVVELRRLDPHVCAIVASGYSNDPVMANAVKFGFCADIAKPFGANMLTSTVARVLADRAAGSRAAAERSQ